MATTSTYGTTTTARAQNKTLYWVIGAIVLAAIIAWLVMSERTAQMGTTTDRSVITTPADTMVAPESSVNATGALDSSAASTSVTTESATSNVGSNAGGTATSGTAGRVDVTPSAAAIQNQQNHIQTSETPTE